MEIPTLQQTIMSTLLAAVITIIVAGGLLYIAHRLGYFHKAMLMIGGLCVVMLGMILTGEAPISPRSHEIIAQMVKETPALNDRVYTDISNRLYISMNDKERLLHYWDQKTELGRME